VKILALDASTLACSVTLFCEGVVSSRRKIGKKLHNEQLLPFIHELTREAGVALSSLDAVAVGVGPGSFVGVRLAVSVAQGIAMAHQLPVITFSSLALLAQTAYEVHGAKEAMVLVDARNHEVYAGHYAIKEGVMLACQPDQLLNPQAIKGPGQCALLGSGWQAYADELAIDDESKLYSELLPDTAKAESILKRAWHEKTWVLAGDVEPCYLRHEAHWAKK